MTSEVDICNRALAEIGTRSTIASLVEASPEAQQCALHYAATRDAALRLHPWNFARKQAPLALIYAAAGTPENPGGIGPAPDLPWNYAYAWPADCLRLRQIYQPLQAASAPAIPYQISGDDDGGGNPIRVILTNQQDAVIVYTRRITVPDLWDTEYIDALAFLLAAKLCGPLTGDKSLAQGFAQSAQQAVLAARSTDDSESGAPPEHLPDWLTVRGSLGDVRFSSGYDTGLLNAVLTP